MEKIKFEGKVIEVKKTETIKEDTEVEEQAVKITTLGLETITLKGPAGFMDDIIIDESDGEVKTKLAVEVTVKRIQKTLDEAVKKGDKP